MRDALARGEDRAPKQILEDMERDHRSRLTASQRERVSQALETARVNEAKITPKMEAIASQSGMRMEGLPSSVKGQSSLERKIGSELLPGTQGTAEHEMAFTDELSQVKDVVRYTMVAPEGEYATATNRAVRAMEDHGFVKEGVKDYWANPTGYRGVNSTWLDPATGQRIEMQFHTPESFEAKTVTHPIYDFSRVADPQMAPQFNELQNKVFDMVPLPEGTTRRGNLQWLAGGDTS